MAESSDEREPVFYKEDKRSQIWWLDTFDREGELVFSFDKKKTFNLFADYPWKLTKEQKEIFDKENPFWARFFSNRKQGGDTDGG